MNEIEIRKSYLENSRRLPLPSLSHQTTIALPSHQHGAIATASHHHLPISRHCSYPPRRLETAPERFITTPTPQRLPPTLIKLLLSRRRVEALVVAVVVVVCGREKRTCQKMSLLGF